MLWEIKLRAKKPISDVIETYSVCVSVQSFEVMLEEAVSCYTEAALLYSVAHSLGGTYYH